MNSILPFQFILGSWTKEYRLIAGIKHFFRLHTDQVINHVRKIGPTRFISFFILFYFKLAVRFLKKLGKHRSIEIPTNTSTYTIFPC